MGDTPVVPAYIAVRGEIMNVFWDVATLVFFEPAKLFGCIICEWFVGFFSKARLRSDCVPGQCVERDMGALRWRDVQTFWHLDDFVEIDWLVVPSYELSQAIDVFAWARTLESVGDQIGHGHWSLRVVIVQDCPRG